MKTWIQKFLSGELGWKAITGAVLILLSLLVPLIGHPEWSETILRVGEGLGIIGLRDALSKLPK